jgi:hypothetical protein
VVKKKSASEGTFFLIIYVIIRTFFKRSLIEGTVTDKVLLSRNRREKKDRIGESQPF